MSLPGGSPTGRGRREELVRLRESLRRLEELVRLVTLLLVPAHCVVAGKEAVDELARVGGRIDQTARRCP